MAAIDAMEVARNQGFRDRVEYLMVKAAIAIMAEDGATANHADRAIWAGKVLNGTANVALYAVGVLTNATIAGAGLNAIDSDLEFTVNSMVNAYAG